MARRYQFTIDPNQLDTVIRFIRENDLTSADLMLIYHNLDQTVIDEIRDAVATGTPKSDFIQQKLAEWRKNS